jgi:hypothetical protein
VRKTKKKKKKNLIFLFFFLLKAWKPWQRCWHRWSVWLRVARRSTTPARATCVRACIFRPCSQVAQVLAAMGETDAAAYLADVLRRANQIVSAPTTPRGSCAAASSSSLARCARRPTYASLFSRCRRGACHA